MREIEFRGQLDGADKWVYGYYYGGYNWADFIISNEGFEHRQRVMHETIGQYTGLKDKNGTKIFENDIVKGGLRNMQIVFKQEACQFWIVWKDINGIKRYEPLNATYGDDTDYFSNDSLEVIGNIHDNPELLKGE